MSVTVDASGSTPITTQTTSATLDITAATVGKWVYAWVALVGSVTVGPTITGWSSVSSDSPNTAIFRRKKVGGDTTFTVNWTSTAQGMIVWVSLNGADPTTPDEAAASTDFSGTTRTTTPTPSASPTSTGRYALAFHMVRTTTSGNKNISWTPDAALTEVIDANNQAAAASAWVGAEIAISPSTVTNASHQYTATHNFTETRDFSAILFIIPAPSSNAQAGFFAAY